MVGSLLVPSSLTGVPDVDDSAKTLKSKTKEEAEELHETNRRVECSRCHIEYEGRCHFDVLSWLGGADLMVVHAHGA
jgi:hypothetical protein